MAEMMAGCCLAATLGACGGGGSGGTTQPSSGGASGAAGPTPSPTPAPTPAATGLNARAAVRGLTFGCAVSASALPSDTALQQVILRECGMLVPESAMKWGVTESVQGSPDYTVSERLMTFARDNGLPVRGHAAFWYKNMPGWAQTAMTTGSAADQIVARVDRVVSHFKDRVFEWDVVNEAIEPLDGQANAMRLAPFGRAMDIGWIADCYHAAHAADPAARLYYTDYGMEYDMDSEEPRRVAVLNLLTELKRRGAPVHGLGLQTHIRVERPFSATRYRTFLGDVAALGLEMRITELDVSDDRAPTDITARDAMVAEHAARVLAPALDETAVKGILCWGLRDTDSWYNLLEEPRSDGTPHRPLPFDANLQKKPLYDAIGAALDAAPMR